MCLLELLINAVWSVQRSKAKSFNNMMPSRLQLSKHLHRLPQVKRASFVPSQLPVSETAPSSWGVLLSQRAAHT